MDFKNAQFSPSAIVNLYKDKLFVIDDIRQVISIKDDTKRNTDAPNSIQYLGMFEKSISVIVADHLHPYINEEDLAFLNKILIACKLSMKDVAIINVLSNPLSEQLWKLMPAQIMLLFDVHPQHIGLSLTCSHFEVQSWEKAQFITAPSIEKFRLANSQELKNKLWTGLQKIFFKK